MASVQELQEALCRKDARIRELEDALRTREEEIMQLRSHLDKFQSVIPYSGSPYHHWNNNNNAGSQPASPSGAWGGAFPPDPDLGPRPRKQRAQGISAEPWSVHELDQQEFQTYPKNDR